jgi:molecular chaperone GrpE (heat shock protein)
VHEVKDEQPADGPPPPDEVGTTDDVTRDDPITTLTAVVSGLGEEIRSHHARAAARERVIDNLHAEVERLRVGERSLSLRPVITDLQHLRTDLLRQAGTLPQDMDTAQVGDLLESFALSVEQALERCGVVPIQPEVGAEFSARQHRAVRVLSTSDPERNGTIAEVVADGYQDNTTDRVTVPAKVHVWRWSAENDLTRVDGEQEEKAEDD